MVERILRQVQEKITTQEYVMTIHTPEEISDDKFSRMRIFTTKGTGTNLERFTTDAGIDYQFNTGHAYREHRTGPDSNPQRAGTVDIVEDSIVDDIQQSIASGVMLPELKPASKPLVQIVTVNSVKIVYRVGTVGGVVRISDYWALP